jgi:phospholipase C
VPRTMRLSLLNLHCVDDTAELGKDDIKIATVAHDLPARRDVTHPPRDLGKFKKTKDPTPFDPPVTLHEFPMVEGALLDQFCPASLYLAEADVAGGLKRYVENDGALHTQELFSWTLLLTMGALSTWLDYKDQVNDVNALSEAAQISGVEFLLKGAFTHPGRLVGFVVALVYGIVASLVDGILALLKDEIFPPQFVMQAVLPNGTILGSGRRTHDEKVRFERKRALYEATVRWEVLMGPGTAVVDAPPGPPPTEAATQAQADANLSKIKHVVVLMLENRSFDHMLGFLRLQRGRNVDGLTGREFNELPGPTDASPGLRFPVFALQDTQLLYDPPHSVGRVRQQVAKGTMSGFVAAYKEAFERQVAENGPVEVPGTPFDPGAVMGYHPAEHVPAFELLATEFGVCDRWFSSFPGNTWVNRTISLTGEAARRSDGTPITNNDPPFNALSFFHKLDDRGVRWKFYSQDIHTVRLVDATYRLTADHFGSLDDFKADAAHGQLPAVSWVEPNFIDVGMLPDMQKIEFKAFLTSANDDHPPVDVTHAQMMVATVFFQLFNSQSWNDTLFIVTYDEHGGFHDHVKPPALPPATAEGPDFETLGCRVPAIVVSPFIGRGLVSSRTFDHTSIIKTILRRFCTDPSGAIPSVSRRVDAADHLGWLLNEPAARYPYAQAKGAAVAVDPRRRAVRDRLIGGLGRSLARIGMRRPLRLPATDLQKQLEDARRRLGMPNLRTELVSR